VGLDRSQGPVCVRLPARWADRSGSRRHHGAHRSGAVAGGRQRREAVAAGRGGQRPLERGIMHHFARGAELLSVLTAPGPLRAVDEYEAQLWRDRLVPNPAIESYRFRSFGAALGALTGVGGPSFWSRSGKAAVTSGSWSPCLSSPGSWPGSSSSSTGRLRAMPLSRACAACLITFGPGHRRELCVARRSSPLSGGDGSTSPVASSTGARTVSGRQRSESPRCRSRRNSTTICGAGSGGGSGLPSNGMASRSPRGIAPCSVELRGASAAVMTLSGLGLLGNGVLVGILFGLV
jgi:hypothetical protein